MHHKDTLVGEWKAVTDGEKLFHFLATNVGEFNGLSHLLHTDFLGIMRGREFARFTQGTIILHCFGRVFQAAKWFRSTFVDEPEKGIDRLNEFIVDTLGIARATCLNFEELAPLAMAAAYASSTSSKTPSSTVKKRVLEDCNYVFSCYSCGTELDPQAGPHIIDSATGVPEIDGITGKLKHNPVYLEHEHLWPHSFGGNSIPDNLLPACPFCNREKKNLVSWEWAQLQGVLPQFQQGSTILDSVGFSRNLKIGLHIRATVAYAVQNGTTLKNAYQLVGPRTDVFLMDQNDTPDFFNLRVHDDVKTGINWG